MACQVALAVASAAIGAVSAYNQYQAAQDAEELARKNAEADALETEEAMRRQAEADAAKQSEARARAAASGVQLKGSTQGYLDDMRETDAKNLAWMDFASKNRQGITKFEGGIARQQGTAAALNTVGSTLNSQWSYWG